MTTLAHRVLHDGVFVAASYADPDVVSWDAFCQAIAANTSRTLRFIVFIDGGNPSPKQRAAIDHAIGKRHARTVFVSANIAVRIAGPLLSALSQRMHGGFYSPDAILEALASVEVTGSIDIESVLTTAAALAATILPYRRLAALPGDRPWPG